MEYMAAIHYALQGSAEAARCDATGVRRHQCMSSVRNPRTTLGMPIVMATIVGGSMPDACVSFPSVVILVILTSEQADKSLKVKVIDSRQVGISMCFLAILRNSNRRGGEFIYRGALTDNSQTQYT